MHAVVASGLWHIACLCAPEVIAERALIDARAGVPPQEELEVHDELGDVAEQSRDQQMLPAAVGRPIPTPPSQREIDLHELTHCPHAAWRPVCIAAKGTEDDHHRVPKRIPIFD